MPNVSGVVVISAEKLDTLLAMIAERDALRAEVERLRAWKETAITNAQLAREERAENARLKAQLQAVQSILTDPERDGATYVRASDIEAALSQS